MPHRNRVTPSGEIVAVPERGTLMGNRGLLHDGGGRVVRPWRERRWIACLLAFKGRRRRVMSPGLYTELFFLDEATALAAGHRPCAECRRDRFDAFCGAWPSGSASGRVKAPDIDARLHAERLGPSNTKRTYRANLDDQPDGVFVRLPERGGVSWLVWNGRLSAWSPGGYGEKTPRPRGVEVDVLTPPSTVAAILAGYRVEVHESAG